MKGVQDEGGGVGLRVKVSVSTMVEFVDEYLVC